MEQLQDGGHAPVATAKWKSMQMNSSLASSTQLISLEMQNSSTCALSQSPTVPLSLRVLVPTAITP